MKSDRSQITRKAVQALSLIVALGFLLLVVLGGKHVIHESCPYAIVCFGLNGAGFLELGRWVMAGAVIVGLGILFYTIFQGRKFCAWLCPLGTVQELIYGLRNKRYRTKHRTPYYVDKKLAFLKYLILAVTIGLSLTGANYLFIRFCPFYGLSTLPKLAWPALAVGGLVVLKSLFGDREWCRFLCPYAALMNAFQGLGDLLGFKRKKIKRNLERCTDCGVCMLYCPMNINIQETEYVHSYNCIHCGLCATHCPKPGTYSEECECES